MPSSIMKGWRLDKNKTRLDSVFGIGGTSDPIILLSMNSTGLSFYDVAPVARAGAYTQTFATADKTHANPTGSSVATTGLVDAVTGNFAYDTAAQGDAVATTINQIIVDLADVKQLVNAVIDDLQAYGLFQ